MLQRLKQGGTWPFVKAREWKALYEEMFSPAKLEPKQEAYKRLKLTIDHAKQQYRRAHPAVDSQHEAAVEALRQHPYYGGASKEALLEQVAELRKNYGQLCGENALLQSKLAVAESKVMRLELERDLALTRAA